jgi:hypothetical protein
MVCREKEKKVGAIKKQEGETLEAKNNKRPRLEPARPKWIEQAQPQTTVQSSYGPWRGTGGGRGRGRRLWQRPEAVERWSCQGHGLQPKLGKVTSFING